MKKYSITIAGKTTEVVGSSPWRAFQQTYAPLLTMKSGTTEVITITRLPFAKADKAARPKYPHPEPRVVKVGDIIFDEETNSRVRITAIEGDMSRVRPLWAEPQPGDVLVDDDGVVVAVVHEFDSAGSAVTVQCVKAGCVLTMDEINALHNVSVQFRRLQAERTSPETRTARAQLSELGL
jgi:hypothetical protein